MVLFTSTSAHGFFKYSNIRADHVLLDTNGEVRLSGLHQLTCLIDRGKKYNTVFKFCGDPEWTAPEVLSQATTFDQKIDIYSIGILVLELFHGKTPYDQMTALKILLCKLHYEIPNIDTARTPSKGLARFVEKCIQKDPNSRYKIFVTSVYI